MCRRSDACWLCRKWVWSKTGELLELCSVYMGQCQGSNVNSHSYGAETLATESLLFQCISSNHLNHLLISRSLCCCDTCVLLTVEVVMLALYHGVFWRLSTVFFHAQVFTGGTELWLWYLPACDVLKIECFVDYAGRWGTPRLHGFVFPGVPDSIAMICLGAER